MTWRTACESANSCVEVSLPDCDSNGSLEALVVDDRVLVRSTLNRERDVEFTREEWVTFLNGVKRGAFDLG